VRATSAIAGYALLWGFLVVVSPFSTRTAEIASNVGLDLAALLGAVAALRRSRRQADGRVWLLLGLGALSWGLGQCTWTVLETFQGQDAPYPSLADIGYVLAVPLLIAGLLSLPGQPADWSTRLRLVLDGALIAISLLAMSWTLLLRDLIGSEAESMLAQALSLFYPVGDVICGTLAVVSLARARTSSAVPLRTLLILSLGLLSFSVGDTGFAVLTMQETYQSGSLVDFGWFCGWLLLTIAALQPATVPVESVEEDRRRRAWLATSAPYVPVVGMVLVNGWWRITHEAFGRVVGLLLLAIVLLIVIRHILTQRENDLLTHSLEARVEERTRALSGWEQWWRALVQNSTDVVTVLRADASVQYQTPSITSVFGYAPQALIDSDVTDLFVEGDRDRFRDCLTAAALAPGEPMSFSGTVRHADGRECATESSVMSLLDDDAVQGLVINTRDVSERRMLETELNHRAFHDELCGLANRALFRNRLIHALEARRRLGRAVGVLFVDLDRFKEVNDTLGHAYGDELLVAIAGRLAEIVRPGDTVARLGGDEFAVLLEHLTSADEAEAVASRIVDVIGEPVTVSEVDVTVRGSVGIALAEPTDLELDRLDPAAAADVMLRNGDIAMYRAKGAGGGSWERYRPELHAALMRRAEIEKELRNALRNDELSVVYQPTASIADGNYIGVEALARWNSPVLGPVYPNEFIPVAEESGLIIDLGAWVLHHACVQASSWLASGVRGDLTLAVNVSGLQLLSSGMVDTVRSALTLSGLPPERLLLEMTESVLLERTEQTLDRLYELKALGVRLAIDDFGTGYSSLSYLSRFPVDVLKVDRSFIAQLQQEASNERELTRTIVQLGESLEMVTVAEGVETHEQLDTLRSLGCDLAQGFLFSEPRPPTEIEPMLYVPLPAMRAG
jgi:diguanylate cyclase (GGDEF)-like protein/PAS domain S-box-containing protein